MPAERKQARNFDMSHEDLFFGFVGFFAFPQYTCCSGLDAHAWTPVWLSCQTARQDRVGLVRAACPAVAAG